MSSNKKIQVQKNKQKKVLKKLSNTKESITVSEDESENENYNQQSEPLYEVEAIRGHKGNGKNRLYQIKWLGYPENQNTWEPLENLQNILKMVKQYEDSLKNNSFSSQSSSSQQKKKSQIQEPNTQIQLNKKRKVLGKIQGNKQILESDEESLEEEEEQIQQISRKNKKVKSENNDSSIDEIITSQSKSNESNSQKSRKNNKVSTSLIRDFLEPNQSFDTQKNRQEKQAVSFSTQDIKIQSNQKVVDNQKSNNNTVSNISNSSNDVRTNNSKVLPSKNVIPENQFKSMSNLLYPNFVPQTLQQSSLSLLSKLTNVENNYDKEKNVQSSSIRSSLLIPTIPQNQNLKNIVQNFSQQDNSVRQVNTGQRLQKLIETPEFETQNQQPDAINPKLKKLNNENQSLFLQLKDELELYKKDMHREDLTDSEYDSDDDNSEDDLESNIKQKSKLKEGLRIFEIHKELELYKGLDIKIVQNLKKQEELKLYENIYNEANLIENQQQYFLGFSDIIQNVKSIDKNLFRHKLQFAPYISQNTLSQSKNDVQIQQNEVLNPIDTAKEYKQQKESIQEQLNPENLLNIKQIPQKTHSNPQEQHKNLIQGQGSIQIQEQVISLSQQASSLINQEESTQIQEKGVTGFKEKESIQNQGEQLAIPCLIQQEKQQSLIQNEFPLQIQGQVSLQILENLQISINKSIENQENQISQIQQKESIQIQERESPQIQQTEKSSFIQERKSPLIQETDLAEIQVTQSPQNQEIDSPQKSKHNYYSDDLSNSLSERSYRRKPSDDIISRNYQTDESEQQILVEDDLDEDQKKILFQNDTLNKKDTPNSSKNDSESDKAQNKVIDSEKELIQEETPIQICFEGISNEKQQEMSYEIKRNKNVFESDSLSSSISIESAQKIINFNVQPEKKQDLEMNLVQTKNLSQIELKQKTHSKDSTRTDSHLSDSLSATPCKDKSNDKLSNITPDSQKIMNDNKNKKQENSSISSITSNQDTANNKKDRFKKNKEEEKHQKQQKRIKRSRKRSSSSSSSSSSRSRSSSSSSSNNSSSGGSRSRSHSSSSRKYKKNQNKNKYQRNQQNPKFQSLSSSKSQSYSSSSNYSRSPSSSSSSSERKNKNRKFSKSSYSQSRSSSIDQRKSNISSRSSLSKDDDFFKKQAISSQSSIDHTDQRLLNKVNFKMQTSQLDSEDQSIKKDTKKVENEQNKGFDQQTKVSQPQSEQQKQQVLIPQNQNIQIKEQNKEIPVQPTQPSLTFANDSAPKLVNPQITDIQPQPQINNQISFKTNNFEPKTFLASQIPQSVVLCSLFSPIGDIQTPQQSVSSMTQQSIAKSATPLPQIANKNTVPQTISLVPALQPNMPQNKDIPSQPKAANTVVQNNNVNPPQAKSSNPVAQSISNNSQSQTKKQNIQQDKKIKTVKPENPFGCRTIYESDEDSSSDCTDSEMDEEINPKKQQIQEMQQQNSVKNTVQQKIDKSSSVSALQKQDSVNANAIKQNTEKNPIVNVLQKQDSVQSQNPPQVQTQILPQINLKNQVSSQDNQLQNNKKILEDQALNQKQNSIKNNQEEQNLNSKLNNISQIPQPPVSVQVTQQTVIQNIENIKDPRIKKKYEQQEKKNQVFDQKLNSLKNNMILFPNIGSLKFDDPERIISHIYHNGQLFFKVSWKPRSDKIQMPPTFIEYFKFKEMYPVICDKYIIPILSSQLIKY
ncbi:chromodomain protein (macronuclear) [Tetrahymena thermophila SB210]|uniref:Chromodomain protein n=1 Tax=Tetrahymena thermophila (strain SB210) TaxID=312017 RepID=I7MGQ2_TETTS|nr:chromodomain protein [Tetrahymena thermophila SB210]EAS01816.2 chromodomain protein [Tetrahymena thermophila SB210]|eukprot:XP_001022061.2 chromodomain protein [Tetrahymena thermophila SB210]